MRYPLRLGFHPEFGEVSEWLIEPVSKTGVRLWRTAGSNPALSVMNEVNNGREQHNCRVNRRERKDHRE